MAFPSNSGVPVSPAQIDAAQQQSQNTSAGSYGNSNGAPPPKPDREALSDGAQRVLDMQEAVDEMLAGKYQDPRGAHARLAQLDEAGQERLRRDPTEIGPLRRGVDPADVDNARLAEFSHAYETQVTSEQRQEAAQYNQADALYNGYQEQQRQQREQAQAMAMDKTPAAQANQSLGGAPFISHHASI